MGIKWKEPLRFGRGLIATTTVTAPAFQSAEKSQRDTKERNRDKNTDIINYKVINNKVIDNKVIDNATIINGTINNSTIMNSTINNTSIHKTEINQHFHQEGAEDPKTPNVNSPIKGSSHPSNNRL